MQHYPLFSSSQPKDISFAERDRNLDYRGDTRAVRNDVNTHSYPYKTYTYGIPDYEGNYQMTNKLYGCQAELLPNPDLYCVERVVRTATNANTLYFKEFTKEYTGDKTCSSLTLFTTTGATRSLLNKEDAGYGTSTRDNTHIIFSSTEYLP